MEQRASRSRHNCFLTSFRFATLSGLIPTLSVLIRSGSVQGRVGIRVTFCLYLCDFFLYLWELFLYTSDRLGKFDTQLEL